MQLLEELNDVQREAVKQTEGPVLIFAGAGSGKTRVLTSRIAYLVAEKNVPPFHILGVTFTNKAASEMKERIQEIIGPAADDLHMGTFHSICARMLREEGHRLGYNRYFGIYDVDDQVRLIKKLMEQYNVSTDMFRPKAIQGTISNAKNSMVSAEEYAQKAGSLYEENVADVYTAYQKELKKNNAMDFDDLLMKPLELFEKEPAVLSKYRKMYQYILVDEYQDTNKAQFEFVRQLAWNHKNVCVVGDDDQSIYRWRGADVRNILEFEETFPDCRVYKLEQNYRSTQNILSAATAVVKNNDVRADKELWSAGEEGEKISLVEANNEREEAKQVLDKIQQEVFSNKRTFSDFVILYRTNAQSRALEDILRQHGIKYVLVGGTKFYGRKEIKDALAYIRVIVNPDDSVAMRRVLNEPTRGIGATTEERLEKFAFDNGITFWEAMQRAEEVEIHSGLTSKVLDFVEFLEKYMQLQEQLPVEELVSVMLEESKLLKQYKDDGSDEALERLDNIWELINGVSEYCERSEEPSLEGFMEEVSLLTDIDQWNEDTNAVTLMTLHSAKGLEFPVVFITGVEDGLFPLSRSAEDPEELAEERRLFYVGITRAQERVYLTMAKQRNRFGEQMFSMPSRFVEEIPDELLEREITGSGMGTGRSSRGTSTRTRTTRGTSLGDSVKERRKNQGKIQVGDTVKHKIFGRGKILDISGAGDNQKLVVKFTGNVKKKLLAKYANLTKIDV
ncbi:MAG: DNA helicase PcrA [Candidatus Marinimicrobia bacterium]|nr:DNA helicase PcrA [Candidatus Neomarinimicrobiota bacterium]MCF7828641.1 DNA helicase PcrA [Candidatus Neomarinimicrobiota bacterium]MCF7880382.1 DNA helicase PcrA [Candidatus Neomarinimicrobiota bacterium]